MTTFSRYRRLRGELDEACRAAGRAPEEVKLLAVSKTVDLDAVEEAIRAGAHAFGENRPDELMRKQAAFPDEEWHFIGNIQSRRIPDIVSCATLIHSVSKEAHLVKIDDAAGRFGKVQPVLLEVNVSGEESKSGFSADGLLPLIERCVSLKNVSLRGLMTMAPRGDEEAIVSSFTALRDLRDDLAVALAERGLSVDLSDISMGMTEDWPWAVGLGTTIVRIGRAVFDDSFE